MIYTSDTIKEILTSPSANKFLDYITPKYDKATNFLWLLQMQGLEWDEVQKWVDEYKDQLVPQTATWSLPYWEQEYDLKTDDEMPIEQRRNAIIAKIQARAPFNPAKLTKLIYEITGQQVNIVENIAQNEFGIYFVSIPDNTDEVFRLVDEYKPAHVFYTLDIDIEKQKSIFIGGAFSQYTQYTFGVTAHLFDDVEVVKTGTAKLARNIMYTQTLKGTAHIDLS